MATTRRDFLRFVGGAAVGAVVSPLPWRLLDDVSIWTQNGSWVAQPPRGPVAWRHTTCTSCPAGCGLRLRLIGGAPVSAWPVPGHPVGGGLCPVGLGIAQLRFHPTRIRGAARRFAGEPWRCVDNAHAIAEIGRKLREIHAAGDGASRIAILDLRPGRSLTRTYREFLDRMGGGRLLTVPDGRERAASALADLIGDVGRVPGHDLARAGTVVSFGGAVERAGATPRHRIEVASHASPATDLADRWLSVRPGTEAAVALGLAHVLLSEGRVPAGAHVVDLDAGYRDLVARFTPEHVGRLAGCDPATVRAVARDLVVHGPVLATGEGRLDRVEEAALWGLNLLLGSVGGPGPVTLRPGLPAVLGEAECDVTSLHDVPDGSLELLIVDGAHPGTPVPGRLLRRKLATETGLLVALSPFVAGPAAAADLVLPTPAWGEWTDDVPPRVLASRTSYAVSAQITAPPAWARHPAALLDDVAAAAGIATPDRPGESRYADRLLRRATALYDRGRGEVFDSATGEAVPVTRLISPQQLAQRLTRGACWSEEPDGVLGDRPVRLLGPDGVLADRLLELAAEPHEVPGGLPLRLMPVVAANGPAGGALPPVLTKLHRESHLRLETDQARVNPATLRACGLRPGRTARLITAHGEMTVRVVGDDAVMPGLIRMATGADPASLGDADHGRRDVLEICDAERRLQSAALREV